MKKKELLLIFILCSMSAMGQWAKVPGRLFYSEPDTTSIYSGKYTWNLSRILNMMKWIEQDQRRNTDSFYVTELDTIYRELKSYCNSRVNYALLNRQINLLNLKLDKSWKDLNERASPYEIIRKEILLKKPDETDKLILEGIQFLKENKQDNAHECFKKAIEKDPARLNNYFFVIIDEMEFNKDTVKALEYLNKVISLSKGKNVSSFQPYSLRAWIYSSKKQYRLSNDDWNHMLEKDAHNAIDSARILNSIGWDYNSLKEYELCVEYAGKSLSLRPDDPYVLDTRGSGYFGLGEYEKCIDSMTKAISLSPELDNSWYLRGLSYLKLNRQGQAISDLSRASEMGMVEAAEALKGLGLNPANKDVENQRFPNKKLPAIKNRLRIDAYGIRYRL